MRVVRHSSGDERCARAVVLVIRFIIIPVRSDITGGKMTGEKNPNLGHCYSVRGDTSAGKNTDCNLFVYKFKIT